MAWFVIHLITCQPMEKKIKILLIILFEQAQIQL